MSFFLSRRGGDPKNAVKKFTKAHRRALEEYADLKISLEELRRRLTGVVEFDFQNHERRLDSHYGTAGWPGLLNSQIRPMKWVPRSSRSLRRAGTMLPTA